jgi:hypothetical protein
MRMIALGQIDHGLAEIDADAVTRLQCVEKSAGSAAEVKDALPLWNEKAHVIPVFLIVETMPRDPRRALVRRLFRLRQRELFVKRISWVCFLRQEGYVR